MTCCFFLRLLSKVLAIELNLQSQLHKVVLLSHRLNYRRNDYFSLKYCSQCFKVKLRQDVIHFFAHSKAIPTQNVIWEPGDDHNKTCSSNVRSPYDHVACLFLIFCIHVIALSIILQSLSLCIFTKISWSTINFKTENGFRLITEYYAFTICVDQVTFFG